MEVPFAVGRVKTATERMQEHSRNLVVFFCSSDGEKVPLEIASTATVAQLRVRTSPAFPFA